MKVITPYLNFDGNCREAMTFYRECLSGELYTMGFGEAEFESPPEAKDRLLHAHLSGGTMSLMASDTMPGSPFIPGNNFWLNLVCDSDEEVDRLFAALSAGGREVMAPQDAFWGSRFAMLTDRFGINWMFNHDQTQG